MPFRTNLGLMLGEVLSGATNQNGRQRGYLDGMRGLEAGSNIDYNKARIGETEADTNIKNQRLAYMKEAKKQALNSLGYADEASVPVDKMPEVYKSLSSIENAYGRDDKAFDIPKTLSQIQLNNLTGSINKDNALDVGTQIAARNGDIVDILKNQMTQNITADGKANANERGLLYSQGKPEYNNLGNDGTYNTITGASQINPQAIKPNATKSEWVYDKDKGIRVNPQTGNAEKIILDGEPVKPLKVDQASKANQGALDSIDTAVKSLQTIINHPGRESATGTSAILNDYALPGTDRAGFKARLETFKAQTFVPMVAQLKGMGALSDAEGKKLTAAVGALDPTMPEEEFLASANEIMKELELKRKRAMGDNVSTVDSVGKQIKRTGKTKDGRKVIEYSDGSREYQ